MPQWDHERLADEVARLLILIDGDSRYGQIGLRERVSRLEHRQVFHRSILAIETLILLLFAGTLLAFYLAR